MCPSLHILIVSYFCNRTFYVFFLFCPFGTLGESLRSHDDLCTAGIDRYGDYDPSEVSVATPDDWPDPSPPFWRWMNHRKSDESIVILPKTTCFLVVLVFSYAFQGFR